MKGSLIILSFFAAGLLLGVYRVMPRYRDWETPKKRQYKIGRAHV